MKQAILYRVCFICFSLFISLFFIVDKTYSLVPPVNPSEFSSRVMGNYAGQFASKITSSLIEVKVIENLQKNSDFISLQNGAIIGSLAGIVDFSIRQYAKNMDWHSEVSFINVEIGSILRVMLSSYFSKHSNYYNIDPTIFLTIYTTADYLLSSSLYALLINQSFMPTLYYGAFNAAFAGALSVISRINSHLFTYYPNATLFGYQLGVAYALGIAFIVAIDVARHAGAAITGTG